MLLIAASVTLPPGAIMLLPLCMLMVFPITSTIEGLNPWLAVTVAVLVVSGMIVIALPEASVTVPVWVARIS